jgi:uncharacterized membrane protein YeaQ/YmgE (transglycosylase-associated protein family)
MVNLNSSLATILVWMLVGGTAGWLASVVVRGSGSGWLGDIIVGIIVGIIGAFLAGLVLSLLLLGTFGFTSLTFGSLLLAFIGAVLLLVVVRMIFRLLRPRPNLEQQLKLAAQAKWLGLPV